VCGWDDLVSGLMFGYRGSGLLGADACCCSVMNFLGHEYVKEKTSEMEDHNYEVRKKRAVMKEMCLWTGVSFLELAAGHPATRLSYSHNR
jgi:hypothetical protein